MDKSILRLLRYNTGNDKKVFIEFKNNFDAVIFNATIVAYSGAAVADLISVHKNQYIIDPQTHIFQHSIELLQTPKSTKIKNSIEKYLNMLPEGLNSFFLKEHKNRQLKSEDVSPFVDELCSKVFNFETTFVNEFVKGKGYEKYLKYVNVILQPKQIIAPYFMLKQSYTKKDENFNWLERNKECLHSFIKLNNNQFTVAAQLVLDKGTLNDPHIRKKIKDIYDFEGYDYLYLWIDEFSSFDQDMYSREAFELLLKDINSIGKKVVMTYGGYDSILLCHKDIENRIFGVAQSVGYGESRPITPVGGGMPTNKYYFYPLHSRMKFSKAADILTNAGFFDKNKTTKECTDAYFNNICKCPQCQTIIKNDIDNFNLYNDAKPYTMKNKVTRNRPTQDALFISAMHFLHCKVKEWDSIQKKNLNEIVTELIENYSTYSDETEIENINNWCDTFVK
jgi:hypothetical protein